MDNKTLIMWFALVTNILLALVLIVGSYSVTHAPTSYELSTAEELRTRITANQNDQRTINNTFSNNFVGDEDSLDEIEQEVERIERSEHIPIHHFHHHK